MKLFPISALAGAVIFSLPNSLSAQEANSEIADTFSEEAEQIVILGSRRPGRSVVESNVPIDLIGEDTMQAGGYTDISRQLQNVVPSFNYYQPSLVDGTEHIKPAS